MIRIEINGVETEAEPGSTIIEVADKLAIPIPRFCYHRKLSVAANCRMCLVQVEKSNKTLPACATPITDGMKVWTASPQAIDSQKSVMEFLLINHPLDCPICDQGGECELQDTSMQYGNDFSRYSEAKRVVVDQNLGPLVATDLTRCIQCTRCVRFGDEIAGERELGLLGRNENVEISTFIEQNVNSEVSGNIIDLCPVGALTSKPFRFRARAWELKQYPSIAPHDCIGSNLYLHVHNNTVMRVVPKSAEELNEIWLSDRDRFSYEALRHDERLRKPMVRKQEGKHDNWAISSWVEALKYAVSGLKLCIDTYGAHELGVLASPSATLEEYYLLQQFARGFGTNNIDHRLRQLDFSDQVAAPMYPNLGINFNELELQDSVLLIGSHIHKELPLAGLKLRKMVLNGGKVSVVNSVDYKFNFAISAKAITAPTDFVATLAGIAKELLELTPKASVTGADQLLAKIVPNADAKKIAAQLLVGKKRHIIIGPLALMHPQASMLNSLATLIAKIINATVGQFSDGANAAGAWLTGCVPHRLLGGAPVKAPGKNARQMLEEPLKCYILYAIEPEFDSILGEQALQTLRESAFVVVFSAYQSETLLQIADVILPLAPFAETSGTLININGTWQTQAEILSPYADSRPGWKILRVMGGLAGFHNFEQESTTEILAEISEKIKADELQPKTKWTCPDDLNLVKNKGLVHLAPVALYSTDSIVRRAAALQLTSDAAAEPNLQLNRKMANSLNLALGDLAQVTSENGTVKLLVEINDQVADQCVVIYQANTATTELGRPYGVVEVSKC